jgi:spore coat polysaccharide biosynthesis predicted glycosyltransferase SpsG
MRALQVCLSITYGGSRGGGHLSRARYYLDILSSLNPITLTLVIDRDSKDLLTASQTQWEDTPYCPRYISAEELIQDHPCIPDLEFDLLLVDRCEPSNVPELLASFSKKVMVISDSIDNPFLPLADLVVDFNYGAEQYKSFYQRTVSSGCMVLLGWEYAPIKPGAASSKDRLLNRINRLSPPWKILITMGAEDPLGFTEKALTALSLSDFSKDLASVKVVQGPLFKRQLSCTLPLPLTILKAPKKLEEYYLDADLCISTGGISTWERLCARLPTRLVPYSQMQHDILAPLQQRRLIELFSDFTSLFTQPLNPAILLEQIEAMCKITLGSRSQEVVMSMLDR